MDPRLISVVLLLMAGVLPLRELSAKWGGRPERRAALRALWVIYLLAALGAIGAVVWTSRPAEPFRPREPAGFDQLAQALPACAVGAARA